MPQLVFCQPDSEASKYGYSKNEIPADSLQTMGDASRFIEELRKTNPAEAAVIEFAINAASGGPVKAGVAKAVEQGLLVSGLGEKLGEFDAFITETLSAKVIDNDFTREDLLAEIHEYNNDDLDKLNDGTGFFLGTVLGVAGSAKTNKGNNDQLPDGHAINGEHGNVVSGKDSNSDNSITSRPLESPHYSNAYEVTLPEAAYPGISRQRHNQLANESLHKTFEVDPAFAAKMEAQYPGIVDGVKPGGRGAYPRTSPTNEVTWHHAPETGKLELLPVDHHTAPGTVQNTLHPDGRGGYSNWGKK